MPPTLRRRSRSERLRGALWRLIVLGLCASLAAARPAAVQEGAPAQAPKTPEEPRENPDVVAIEVSGNQRYTSEQLVAALGQPLNRPLDLNAVSDGLHALWTLFRVRGEVDLREVEDGVVLRLSVVEMPFDLEPRFVGNVEIDDEELREWARLEPEGELYLHQAPRVRERLLEAYRREGFYFVEIHEVVRKPEDTAEGEVFAPDVIFEIREGPRVHVGDVVIHGNRSMPDRGFLLWKDGLRKFADVELGPPKLFGLFKDEFYEETLLGDLQAMRQVYRDRGWLDAVVDLRELDFSEDRSWVTIHVQIDEGPRYKVGSLRIEGYERYGPRAPDGTWPERRAELLFPEHKLRELCELKPGSFLEQRFVQRDAGKLRDFYGERGYVAHDSLPPPDSFAFLPPELTFEEDAAVVHIVYRLAQGHQQFVREILITGNTNTKDRVIRGRITVEPGKVADLGEITRSRARIQALGFFSDDRPDAEHVDPYFRFRETDDPAWKDLEYVVDETNALTFNATGGISSNNGLFGVFSLQKQNFDLFDLPSSLGSTIDEIADGEAFHGAGQNLRLLVAPGTETSSFEIRFREPDIFRRYTAAIGFELVARRSLRIYDSHDEEREEYGTSLRYQLTPDSTVSLGYTWGIVDIDDLDEGGEPTLGHPLAVPELLKDQEGESDLAWINASYEYSALDDFFYPQNGNTLDAGVQVYDEGLGSDFSFVKTSLYLQHLGQFGEDSLDARSGYKLELGAGVATPYGDTDDVPYSERFFLGGLKTLRGFDLRGVGPNENGFPIGGQTFTSFTAEYRQPLIRTIQPGTFREVEVIRGGFFLDAGILDPEDWTLDPDELRASAGVFIGLTMPLAFTFSFGFPIREGSDDDTQVFQFNIGF